MASKQVADKKVVFRANLANTIFPFSTRFSGRTVIVPGLDQNAARLNQKDADKDAGIPQVYFMENVIPTDYGFSSVGYYEVADKISVTAEIKFPANLRDENSKQHLYAYVIDPANGANSGDYLLTVDLASFPAVWEKLDTALLDISSQTSGLITDAYVVGRQFVYYSYLGLREFIAGELVDVSFTGLDTADIRGIIAADNYLIAYSSDSIFWSSLTDPLDFVPSLSTGAGGITVSDLKGSILVCRGLKDGFVIYTENNAVSATITDSVDAPFYFREISGSLGITDTSVPVELDNLPTHIINSPAGIQSLNKSAATNILPEVSDFVSNKIVEDYDTTTGLFTETVKLRERFLTKITQVTNRFVTVSYGFESTGFTHALLFDTLLNKWGKLKKDHGFVLTWPFKISYSDYLWRTFSDLSWGELGTDTWSTFDTFVLDRDQNNKQVLSFLNIDGSYSVLATEATAGNRDGVFVLGKYQLDRSHDFQLTFLDVEAIQTDSSNFSVSVLTSYQGRVTDIITDPMELERSGYGRSYGLRVTGQNHSICFSGTFDLSSILLSGNLFAIGKR